MVMISMMTTIMITKMIMINNKNVDKIIVVIVVQIAGPTTSDLAVLFRVQRCGF